MRPTRDTELAIQLGAIAMRAASAAAAVHAAARRKGFAVAHKTSGLDLVTTVDREAEQAAVEVITQLRPNDSIVGEEGAATAGGSGVRWILDALDGTTNYVYGYPATAVSVGVEIHGQPSVGVVIDTASGRVFHGTSGGSATCDDVPIRVREVISLDKALLATGLLPHMEHRRHQAGVLAQVLEHIRDIRRSGSPALDLCALAAGWVDGVFETGLGPWDIAAGRVVAEAAGAVVRVLPVESGPQPLVVAASAGIIEPLCVLVQEAIAASRG